MKKLKRVVFILVVALLAAVALLFKSSRDLKQARANFVVKEVIREVPGPVRIKYRKVKQKPEVVEKIVYQDRIVQVPAPEPTPEPPVQSAEGYDRSQDRIVAGVAIHGLGSKRFYQSFMAGYSFGNKLDVLGGVSPDEKTKYTFQTNYRF